MNRKNPARGGASLAGGIGPSLHRNVALAATVVLALALAPMAQAQRTQLKPGWNMFSPQQDVEVGQQVAYEAERQLPLVYDSRVDDYLNTLGRRLAAHAPGQRFPYTYKMVNDPTINAFALPGGPVYINRGVIDAAENEAQLAGVMAHETAHVALRHGTNQASKAYLAQFPLAILGGVIRSPGVGMLAQIGGGFAAQSLFLKYSRNAESQADILGAQILYDSGYDPRALVQFFERIQGRSRGGNSTAFFSNHPNPENRAGRVNQEVQKLGGGSRNLMNDSPQFQEIKRYLQGQSSSGASPGGYSDRPRLERAPGSQSDVRPQSPSDRSIQGTPAGSDSDRPRLERAPGSGDQGQYGAPPVGPSDRSTQGTPAGSDSDRPRLERVPGSGDTGQSGAQPQ
ncbi:MAG: M48 family metallopeptidase [Acidobacteriota bacterium]|nr:M48 family metallopeptidase [Acidobacteriota bacterium]